MRVQGQGTGRAAERAAVAVWKALVHCSLVLCTAISRVRLGLASVSA